MRVLTKIKSKANYVWVAIMSAFLTLVPCTVGAFADTDVFGQAKTTLKNIYDGFWSISSVACAVAAIIALFFLIFSKNQRSVESAKEWLKRIIIGYLIICALGLIINTVGSWTSGMHFDG